MSFSTTELINRSEYYRLLGHACLEEDFVYLGSTGSGVGRGSHAAFSAQASDRFAAPKTENEAVDPASLAESMEAALGEQIESGHDLPENAAMPGGWIGFIGYEFGYETESKLEVLRQQTSVRPPLLSAGLYHWMASYARKADAYFLWFHKDCPDYIERQVRTWLNSEVSTSDPKPFRITSPFNPRQTRDAFTRSVEQIRDYINAGDCYQVNLSQEFVGTFSGSPWLAFQALSDAHPTPHSAFIRAPGLDVLSISPERFLKISGQEVGTSPIKGTRKRGQDAREDAKLAAELEASEKDRAENLMIVDLLRNDLSRHALAGSVLVDKLFELESYRNVHHLVSHIRCTLKPGVSPLTALFDAFPGGSITGAPKIRAMEIIRELEPHVRGPYCGSVFHRRFDGSLESNIAIRTLYCSEKGEIHCCGGGGVVADSEPLNEYQETLTKVKPLMDFLESL